MIVLNAISSDVWEEIPVARTPSRRKRQESPPESFGQRLARLRKASGYTQTELGEILELSQRMMTYYEREGGRPPAHLLGRMAETLGVSVEELLGLRPVKEKPAPRNSRLWRKLREVGDHGPRPGRSARPGEESPDNARLFVPVQLLESATTLEIIHPLGYRIQVTGDVNPVALRHVIEVLEERGER